MAYYKSLCYTNINTQSLLFKYKYISILLNDIIIYNRVSVPNRKQQINKSNSRNSFSSQKYLLKFGNSTARNLNFQECMLRYH